MIRLGLPARIGILVLAAVSPFFFPYPLTILLALAAAFVFPPSVIALGILIDLLYHPVGYWPIASMIGVALCLLAFGVRYFVKTRIM